MTATTAIQTSTNAKVDIRYGTACVSDISVRRFEVGRGRRNLNFKELEIEGQVVRPTRRFWRSFFTRFGIAENVFRYFTPDEVFERIKDRSKECEFRYCIAQNGNDHALLAITNLNRPVIRHSEVCQLVSHYGGNAIKYNEGVVTSTHQPRGGSRQFSIGGDQFQDRYILETPIDGYGHPRLYLSLLRLICSNGAVGYSRAFRSDISNGKNMEHCITRALESFDNGEGYVALRQRFESAQNSWASVSECLSLGQCLEKLSESRCLTSPELMGRFCSMAGDLSELYGLANLEALSDKRRRLLPAKCRVYDLINFASEVATHHCLQSGSNRIQAYIGSLISDEYDLEGTAQQASEFDAFFLKPRANVEQN